MAGRRTKYTPELANEIVAGIAIGLTDRDAAIAAGISEDTFGRWMNAQRGAPADLADRVTRARTQRSRLWLGGIRRAADSGDWKAYAELLDRCAPDYRKTQKHELSGADGGPILLQQVAQELAIDFDLDPDELAHEVEAYLAANR